MNRILLSLFFAAVTAQGQQSLSGEDIVRSMHDRYAGKWYKTLTFVQKTTQYRADTVVSISTWYEAFSFPGTMRIDIDTPGTSGMILTRDSLTTFRNGSPAATRYYLHPLLLLGFDVYFLEPSRTVELLRKMHVDLSLVHDDEWQGRAVYVVGAKKGDVLSPQFWIDREHLYFVRLLEKTGREGSQVRETQFNDYRPLGAGWISAEVVFKVDGKIQMTEKYFEITPDPILKPALFDPRMWRTATWKEGTVH